MIANKRLTSTPSHLLLSAPSDNDETKCNSQMEKNRLLIHNSKVL